MDQLLELTARRTSHLGFSVSQPFEQPSYARPIAMAVPPATPAPATGAKILLGDLHQRPACGADHLVVGMFHQLDESGDARCIAEMAQAFGRVALLKDVRSRELAAQGLEDGSQA